MCGFLKVDETAKVMKSQSSQNVQVVDSESSFDIYEQEFLLHAYCMILREKKTFVESKEGYTYLSALTEQTVSSRLLNFVPAKDAIKWQVIINI